MCKCFCSKVIFKNVFLQYGGEIRLLIFLSLMITVYLSQLLFDVHCSQHGLFPARYLVMLLSVHYEKGSRMIFDIFEIVYHLSLMSYPHTDLGCVVCLLETTP